MPENLKFKNMNLINKDSKISKLFYFSGALTVVFALLAIATVPLLKNIMADAHAPEIVIQKFGSKTIVKQGDTMDFTIRVTNNGDPNVATGHNDMTAYNLEIKDNLPNGFERASNGDTSLNWAVGQLAAGEVWEKTFTVKISQNANPGGYLNVAEVKAQYKDSGVWKDYPTQKATFAVKVEELEKNPNLAINKQAHRSEIEAGDTVIYTITVTNNGDGTAKNLKVTDVLPDGFVVLSSGNSVVEWTKNELAPNNSWTNIFTSVSSSALEDGTYINEATVVADNNSPKTASVSVNIKNPVIVTNPELSVNKTASSGVVDAGGVANYTVSVTNLGDGVAVGVSLSDQLSVGFTHTTGGQLRTWDLGDIIPGQTKTVNYLANVSSSLASGSYVNTATVTASNASSISDTAIVTVQNTPVVVTNPSLSLNKIANTSSVNSGGTASYTISVTNSGNEVATNVTLLDALPNGFTFSATGQSTRTWALGNLSPNETKNISYTALVDASVLSGSYINTATVTAGNHVSLSDTATVQVTAGEVLGEEFDPIIIIEKTANKKVVNPGGTATYTITVKNIGEADAINLTLSDAFPQGFSEIDTGAIKKTWTRGLLEKNGGEWQVTYRVRIASDAAETDYINTAIVSAENYPKQVKSDYIMQVRKGEVLGDTGVTPGQMAVWIGAIGILGLAMHQLRRKFAFAKIRKSSPVA